MQQLYDLSRALIGASDLGEMLDAALHALEHPAQSVCGYLVMVQPDGAFYHARPIGTPLVPQITEQHWREAGLTLALLASHERARLACPWREPVSAAWEQALCGTARLPLALVVLQSEGMLIGAIIRTVPESEPQAALEHLVAIGELLSTALMRVYRQHGSIQQAKIASIGRLTAAIAHEINNPLQAIANALYLVTHQEFSDEDRVHYLSRAQREVEHMAAMVRRMLDFYQPHPERMRPLRIHALLEQTIAIVTPQAGQSHVVIERNWAEESLWVNGVSGHLKQVFLSLLLTTLEAVPHGGTLAIRTTMQSTLNAQGKAVVVVEISGAANGLSASVLSNLFEPSFRARSHGSGIGLPVSSTIIEQHGGSMSARWHNDAAVFEVMLPAMRA